PVAFKCCEVTPGEGDVKLLHARAVLKEPVGDALLNLERHVPIERREVTEPSLFFARAENDLIEFDQNFVDGFGRHGRFLSDSKLSDRKLDNNSTSPY